MTRSTAAVTAEVTAQTLEPAIAVELFFDSGALRIWSGHESRSYGGNSFVGAGNLLSINLANESTEISAKSVSVGLNGINSSVVSLALSEDYRDRTLKIWLWFLDSGSIVADPYNLFTGYMNTINISDAGETCSISVTAESRLVDLQRPRLRRYTSEDQKIDFPSDLGLDFVTSIQEAQVKWGS
jgi:hypothetical protein